MSDAARPAIDSGTVFAVGHAGRMIATQSETGERLWSLNVPGMQQPWVAGDSVFVVDTSGQLMAITRKDGKIQWTTKLPEAAAWCGPTLAGGTLWLASAKGALVGVDAATGRITTQKDLGSPVYIAPDRGAGANVHPDRQRQADRAQLSVSGWRLPSGRRMRDKGASSRLGRSTTCPPPPSSPSSAGPTSASRRCSTG